jgi:hypothetical protein
MMMFAYRHLRHNWRLNWGVLLCLTLASSLLASLSGYAAAVSAEELQRNLEGAGPAERSLLITGTLYTFGDELYASLEQKLGRVLEDRLVIRHATLPADPGSLEGAGAAQEPVLAYLDVYSFDKLAEKVHLVEGRLPEQVSLGQAVGNSPPPIEAVIGATAAEQGGFGPGDRLTASGLYHRLDIVGVVEPLEPEDDVWGGDLGAFALAESTEPDGGTITLPLIITAESMRSYLGRPIFPHEVTWRITLNTQLVGPNTAKPLQSNLVNLETQATARGATISTGLVEILAETLGQLSQVQTALLLLTIQILLFVLYVMVVFTPLVTQRIQAELATLSARGASAWQTTRLFALQNLILALVAGLLLGPALAWGGIYLWSRAAGAPISRLLPGEAWLWSSIAAGLGWLISVSAVFLAARRKAPNLRPPSSAPRPESLVQRHYVDLYLLAFAGILYWQLNQKGSFLLRQLGNRQAADPILLIGPTLLVVAVAIVSLRIVPLLLRLLAWPLRRLGGWVLPSGLLHLARDRLAAGRLVLLVGLTAGLVLFGHTFGATLSPRREPLPADPLLQGVSDTLQLCTFLLLLFGVAAFYLVSILSARERRQESEFLFALGLSMRQWLATLVVEGVMVVVLGLVAGGLGGWGLAHIMLPYLSQSLTGSLADGSAPQVVIDWFTILRAYALLLPAYGLALVGVWLALWRSQGREGL